MLLTRRRWLQAAAGSFAGLPLQRCVSDSIDVCIVGSGPAGAVLAGALASRSVKTLLLEGGPNPTNQRNIPEEPVDLDTLSAPIAYPTESTRFLGDGGTSNLWAGECPRFRPMDFEPDNSYAPPEAPWPINYRNIEPYYQKAEEELSIAASGSVMCLREVLGVGGWLVEQVRRSSSPKMSESQLPRLVGLTSAVFQRGVRVKGVILGPEGHVSHLEAREKGGKLRRIQARYYVLACGGIETPRLLLRSRTASFPHGIGNSYGQVGRYFMEHLSVDLGVFQLPTETMCKQREYGISWQFSNQLKSLGLGNALFEFYLEPENSLFSVAAVLEMQPSGSNRVSLSATDTDAYNEPVAEVSVMISDNDRKTCKHAKEIAESIAIGLRAHSVQPPTGHFRWCHHHMGTCRMGRDPSTSVVDSDLRVHGIDNLYISGSASFVTCSAGSPTLLLTALGLRLADHLAARI